MRYIVTFFWVFLLMQMVTYVVSSMIGVDYSFQTGAVLSIPITIIVSLLPLVIPNEPVDQH
ncbi:MULTISPECIES: YjzD family protein [Bacillus]|uniref:YjzD family protein n=1 Tax=Bacillus TaxID=1386 RepID=UPI000308C5C3|nr:MULTISPECIES: YjzD family protein [Bacillus]